MPDVTRELLLSRLASQTGEIEQGVIRHLLEEIILEKEKNESFKATPEEVEKRTKILKERYKSYGESHVFVPGQIIRWKPGLRNRRLPQYDEPVIVIEVLDSPIIEESESTGSTYFRERLDMIIGVVDEDGDLVCFHYDSRRFEIYK